MVCSVRYWFSTTIPSMIDPFSPDVTSLLDYDNFIFFFVMGGLKFLSDSTFHLHPQTWNRDRSFCFEFTFGSALIVRHFFYGNSSRMSIRLVMYPFGYVSDILCSKRHHTWKKFSCFPFFVFYESQFIGLLDCLASFGIEFPWLAGKTFNPFCMTWQKLNCNFLWP